MIRIDTATYAESVSCTPRCEIREPIGPIENGTTYIVRPRIAPSNSSRSRARISWGSRQLFVGPASASRCEQMKVRSSTRATSPGSDSARYEFGRLASASFWKVPPSTSVCASWSYSSAVPSHQWISSGCVSAATSSTHPFNRAWLVRTWWRGVVWDMSYHALLGVRIAQLAYPCGWDRRRVAGCQRARRPARWLAKVPEQTLGGPGASLRRSGRGLAPRHEHDPLEVRDQHPILVEHPGVDANGAAIRLRARRLHLEHLRLAEQGVAVEDRGWMVELLCRQVGDRLAADVRDGHPQGERVDERADDDVATLLRARRVDVVDVQRVVGHRQQAEEVIVGLGDGLGRPVLVDGADFELLQVATVGMGAAGLARGLIGLDSGHRCTS